MNYPNPFKDGTAFTFQLSSDAVTDVTVHIFTVTGREIRTLSAIKLHAGLNWIAWDGRDDAGNDVSNGTYLYRLVMSGKNADGTPVTQAVTQTMVRAQ